MYGLLKDKYTVVVGAAQGIGEAVAKIYSENGAAVALLDRDYERACETAERISKETGNPTCAFVVDVSCKDSVEAAFDKVAEKFPRIDAMCNTAGILIRRPFLEFTVEDWDKLFSINARGAFNVMQTTAKHMLETGGKIITISSAASKKPSPMEIAYCSTKAAVNAMTRTAAYELGPYNINVNAICPGATDTQMTRSTFLQDPKVEQEWIDMTVLKRLSQPIDQARVALFLASELSNHITGEAIIVSAGELMGQ